MVPLLIRYVATAQWQCTYLPLCSLPGTGKKEKIRKGMTQSSAKAKSTPMMSIRIFSETLGVQNMTKQSCRVDRTTVNQVVEKGHKRHDMVPMNGKHAQWVSLATQVCSYTSVPYSHLPVLGGDCGWRWSICCTCPIGIASVAIHCRWHLHG